MDGVSRLQTRGWRKVGHVKGSKGIGFDVFNDDLIIIKGGRVLIFAATMLDHTVLRLGIRFSLFFFFFQTTWDFGYICRYFQANGKGWAITGVEMLLEVCDASIREMDDRDTGDRSIEFQ